MTKKLLPVDCALLLVSSSCCGETCGWKHSYIIFRSLAGMSLTCGWKIFLYHSQVTGRHEIIEGMGGQAWNHMRGRMRDQTIHLHNTMLIIFVFIFVSVIVFAFLKGRMRNRTIHPDNIILLILLSVKNFTWVCQCLRQKCWCRSSPHCFPPSLVGAVVVSSSPPEKTSSVLCQVTFILSYIL